MGLLLVIAVGLAFLNHWGSSIKDSRTEVQSFEKMVNDFDERMATLEKKVKTLELKVAAAELRIKTPYGAGQ